MSSRLEKNNFYNLQLVIFSKKKKKNKTQGFDGSFLGLSDGDKEGPPG